MGRYIGTSPFQNKSLVWSVDNGLVIKNGDAAGIVEKPEFSWEFDALLCEPNNCHYINNDREFALNEGMIEQVMNFIDGFAIHGLDQYNHYIGSAKQGEYVGQADYAPPPITDNQYWTWDSNERVWFDDRNEEQILAGKKEKLINSCFAYMKEQIEYDWVELELSDGNTYPFGCDHDTQGNIEKALLGVLMGTTPNPRYWTPKGYSYAIQVTHDDVKNIASAVGNRYDSWVQSYLIHKFMIMASNTEQFEAYDFTTGGWPNS